MLLSFVEIFNLVVVSLVVGYIFSGMFKNEKLSFNNFDWKDFRFAVLIASPGIIFHELAHKFVAIGFGLNAVFEISPFGLVLGVVLKLVGSPLILLAPGYVLISSLANPLAMFLTAFAGPLTNLLFWLGSKYYLNSSKTFSRKMVMNLFIFSEINKWLFLFNMIPIPPLDGYKVFLGLYNLIFNF